MYFQVFNSIVAYACQLSSKDNDPNLQGNKGLIISILH